MLMLLQETDFVDLFSNNEKHIHLTSHVKLSTVNSISPCRHPTIVDTSLLSTEATSLVGATKKCMGTTPTIYIIIRTPMYKLCGYWKILQRQLNKMLAGTLH